MGRKISKSHFNQSKYFYKLDFIFLEEYRKELKREIFFAILPPLKVISTCYINSFVCVAPLLRIKQDKKI